ncbi:MAG: glycosyltransferase, partial [Candidatus Omnitrophica bacterium]|nr:glycosyltransferase [Candidatus Omnitrophota bacterium]
EIVTCGNNKKVYSRLKKKQKHYKKKMLLLSYAHNMEELMSAADLIITKPGGITCAEALSKGLPMLIVSPIPGQEANNTSFLVGQKAAIKIANAKDLVKVITDLYNHPEKLKALSESAKRISKPAAAEDIAKLLSGL